MNPIYLVAGPPAVGKSTTSRALAAHFPKSLHIPVDDIRNMVVSGIELPGPIWSDELAQQVALARTSVIQMSINYHYAGFVVVIDDFWDTDHLLDYQTLFSYPDLHRIVLYPGQGAAHQRNFWRSGVNSASAYIDEGIRTVYQQLNAVVSQLEQEGWIIVDTTSLSVEQTVTTILQRTAATS